jgi:hypothetical protein
MKTKVSLRAWCMASIAAGVLSLSSGHPAQAQSAITPAGGGRFYVELKDATLADALEMVFKAAGNPSHLIDDSAKTVSVASITFNNVAWDSIVRQLANQNGFLVRKNASGTTMIEPRTPPATEGAPGAPGVPGLPGGITGGTRPTTPPRTIPANPFGASYHGDANGVTTMANAQYGNVPAGNTQSNAQFNNRNNRNNRNNNNNNNRNSGRNGRAQLSPDGDYRLVVVRHIYSGGIANVFAEGDIIQTEDLVVPASAGSGIGSMGGIGGGFGGGMMGGMGGMGGMMGGMGGMMGGVGGIGGGSYGGGYGGNTGGMGGFFSDRNLKENFDAVNNRAILERVKDLPLTSWNYKAEDPAIRHIGPMAQDFAKAFGLGEDNRRINVVDANGVTLASIQALYQMVQEQATQIKTLQGQIEQLKTENQNLRAAPVSTTISKATQ